MHIGYFRVFFKLKNGAGQICPAPHRTRIVRNFKIKINLIRKSKFQFLIALCTTILAASLRAFNRLEGFAFPVPAMS